MHPDFDIQSSLDQQAESLRKRYEKELRLLNQASADPREYVRACIKIGRQDPMKLESKNEFYGMKLTLLALLEGNFREAYTRNALIDLHRILAYDLEWIAAHPPFHTRAAASDPVQFWEDLRDRKNCRIPGAPPFHLDDTEQFQQCLAKQTGNLRGTTYDFSGAARQSTVGGHRSYYLGWEQPGVYKLPILLAGEMHAEASECIFRMKHTLASAGPPSHVSGMAQNRQFAPVTYMFEAWLQARLEPDPQKRKKQAWIAIYWLLDYVQCSGRVNQMVLSGGIVSDFCRIAGDFDLFESNQPEFLKYFKIAAMTSCPSTARKVMADPTRAISYAETGLPGIEQCKEIFDEFTAEELARRMGGGKKKASGKGGGKEANS